MLEPGDIVERYEVLRTLGEGGMARVVLVRHTTLGTRHALKVLTLTGPSLKERLVAEGKAQAQLRHDNVVRVSDVLEVAGMPALVMDFIDGPDLGRWIAENEPDAATAERVFRGVVAGVSAAHRAGRIHRDLKPANVLLEIDGDRIVPKVADFGLVKAVRGEESSYNTRAGVAMGTPRYMAPEQFRDAANVDERADVYSLGAILYELLAHHPPTYSDDLMEIFEAASTGRRAPLPPTVPPHLRRVVDACLQPRATDRPADCDAVLAMLGTSLPSLGGSSEPSATALPTMPENLVIRPSLPAPHLPRAVVVGGGVLAAAGATAGVGLLVVTLFVVIGTHASDTTCPTEGGVLGVARVDAPVRRKRWKLQADASVLEHVPTEGEAVRVVCTLPAGSTVLGVDAPRKVDDDTWATIVAEDLRLPDQVLPVVAGTRNGTCEGEQGETIGWYRTRPGIGAIVSGGPRVGQPWQPGAGREVVEWPPTAEHDGKPGPVVCVLGEMEVMVVEPPVKIGRDFWVPYTVP